MTYPCRVCKSDGSEVSVTAPYYDDLPKHVAMRWQDVHCANCGAFIRRIRA